MVPPCGCHGERIPIGQAAYRVPSWQRGATGFFILAAAKGGGWKSIKKKKKNQDHRRFFFFFKTDFSYNPLVDAMVKEFRLARQHTVCPAGSGARRDSSFWQPRGVEDGSR